MSAGLSLPGPVRSHLHGLPPCGKKSLQGGPVLRNPQDWNQDSAVCACVCDVVKVDSLLIWLHRLFFRSW